MVIYGNHALKFMLTHESPLRGFSITAATPAKPGACPSQGDTMSRAIVENQRGSFDFAFSLLQQYMEVCPDEIWNKKFGGWPVWQQVYHALNAVDFFIAAPGAEPVKGLVPAEVGSLKVQGEKPVSRDEMKEFAKLVKSAADGYMNALNDADMTKISEGATARMGRETRHATVMALMIGHILYHLGSCDAALREQGLKGVF